MSVLDGYFKYLYKGVDAFAIFNDDTQRLGIKKKTPDYPGHFRGEAPEIKEVGEVDPLPDLNKSSFVYGEAKFTPLRRVLREYKPGKASVFYDLGSGSGKVVFTAALSSNFKRVCGVEYLPGLTALSNKVLKRYNRKIRPALPGNKRTQSIEFVNSDFLKYDFSDADMVYIPSTTFNQELMDQLALRLRKTRPGTVILTLTESLPEKIFHKVTATTMETSWSSETQVIVYKRRWKVLKREPKKKKQREPKTFKETFAKANGYYTIRSYEKAVKYYTKAERMSRRRPFEVYYNRALAYYQLKRIDKSVSDADKALKKVGGRKSKRDLADVYYLKGLILEADEKLRHMAKPCYRKTLELNPRHKNAREKLKEKKETKTA